MAKTYFYILLATTLFFLFSCEKEKDAKITDIGYNYFPLQVGSYWVYDVDSVVYDDFENDTDYYHYRIKEYVESTFQDFAGNTAFRIERYVKHYNAIVPYDSISWQLQNVCFANKTKTTAEKVEENMRYVKLIFPVEENKTWNGNSYNMLGEMDYTYESIDQSKTINNLHFDSTLVVQQSNTTNAIEKKYYIEIFAKNIGLVKKEIVDIYSSKPPLNTPVTSRIEKGFTLNMSIVEYGKQ
ncbi:MAG: hypothetical protein J0M08_05310 [Bacteroidetes bacterium]|nr:hypothetical protein [Bacteroidota bacterium]